MNFKKRIIEELKLSELQANTLLPGYIKTCEKLAKEYHQERSSQLEVGCKFLRDWIDKEIELKLKLQENLKIYQDLNNMVEYDKTFSQWNKCNLVLWDLKDALYRFGIEIN
jgi:hypothetical protein